MKDTEFIAMFGQVVDRLYASSLKHDGASVGEFLNLVRQWLCVDEVSLVMLDEQVSGFGVAEGTSMTDADFQHYLDNIHADNVWVHGLEARPSGIAYRSCDLYPSEKLANTRFYEEYLRYKQYFFAAGGYFQDTNSAQGMLTVYQSASRGRVAPDTLFAVQACFPHLHRAMELRRTLHSATQLNNCFLSAFTAMNKAVIAVDEKGKILVDNHLVHRLLPANGMSINNQRLLFSDPEINRLFSQSLSAAGGLYYRHPHIVWLSQGALVSPLKVTFMPVSEEMGWMTLGPAVKAIVIIQRCFQNSARTPEPLRKLWRLTRAEAELAIRLAEGRTLKEIADALCISHETARSHLKAIFHKSATHSQNELIMAIAALF